MSVPVIQMQLSLDAIDRAELNDCLLRWEHKMGAWRRVPELSEWFHGLRHDGQLVAVMAAGQLIRDHTVGGITRDQAFELGRVCAARPHINRAALRLWREFVAPAIAVSHGYSWVISYQDANLHTGNMYRFDGWQKLGVSRSGTDQRSGAKGRSKVVWGWPLTTKQHGGPIR